jgi:hypothetical protein
MIFPFAFIFATSAILAQASPAPISTSVSSSIAGLSSQPCGNTPEANMAACFWNDPAAKRAETVQPVHDVELAERGDSSIVNGVRILIGAAVSALEAINEFASEDHSNRANGIRGMVDRMIDKFPGHNVVICHTAHEARFDGQQGVDWIHQHFEIDMNIGGTVGYEVRI